MSKPGEPTTNAEQMAATGDGDIAKKQEHKGGFGEQQDLAGDLDRKKEEQKGKREEVMGERESNVDIGGALGGRTGPSAVEGR